MNKSLSFSLTFRVLAMFLMLALLLGCTLPSGGGAGPLVWIDQPLDGARVPIAPLILQAHAADADGIANIEFLVFDELIASVTSGGTRLEEASVEWLPPYAGTYTINVRALDSQGNTNVRTPASVHITVGDDIPSPDLPTSTPAANPSVTALPFPGASPTVTLTMVSDPLFMLQQNANCRLGPATGYDAVDVLLQGTVVAIQGRNADNTWFWVKKPSGTTGNCWVSSSTGVASGNWQVVQVVVVAPLPSTIAATPMLPATATSTPADFTPPRILNVSINPTTVAKAGCGTPDTLAISAIVTDASGIANVTYEVTGPGTMDAGDGYLLPMGGDLYQAAVGPIAGNAGTWIVMIYATDMLQNVAEAGPWTFQVVCID